MASRSIVSPSTVLRALLCVALLLTSTRGQEKPLTLTAAKAAFDKADRALNAAWDTVKKEFSPAAFAALKEEQRGWVEWRDQLATSPGLTGARVKEGQEKQTPEYFSLAAGLTEDRTAWLKGLTAKSTDGAMTGKWIDSYGGMIQIVEKDGRLHFSINVVRGPTAHVGELSGTAVWNQTIGWFSDKGREKDRTEETNLAFVMDGMKLRIAGANTQHYHGARAYFDGDYVKTGSLDAKAREAVLKSAKDGSSLQ